MPTVLIVDENKPSLVMTSEILKDHVSGVVIEVVGSGKGCLELASKKTYDLIIIDFDLPDADGVTLAKLIRNQYDGPILLTAFDDEVVQNAIKTEMFVYSDICSLVSKPIVSADFVAKINKFLLKKHSIRKRFATDLPIEISQPSLKKTQKGAVVKGKMVHMSISGAGIKIPVPFQGKLGDEVSLTLDFRKPPSSKKTKEKESQNEDKSETNLTKIKAQLVWLDKTKKKAGFKFSNLSEKTLKEVESVLRSSKEIDN